LTPGSGISFSQISDTGSNLGVYYYKYLGKILCHLGKILCQLIQNFLFP
jgi:hypothetical protein